MRIISPNPSSGNTFRLYHRGVSTQQEGRGEEGEQLVAEAANPNPSGRSALVWSKGLLALLHCADVACGHSACDATQLVMPLSLFRRSANR